MRHVALWLLLAAPLAQAQNNDWTINLVSGTPVMDEVSPLVFRVGNAATSRDPLYSFTIGIPNGPYDINGATAPVGWRTATVDKKDRKITFLSTDACGAGGLLPGQAALFEVRVVGVPRAADAPGQSIDTKRTGAIDVCNTKRNFRAPTGAWTWTLVGLLGRVSTSTRALDVNNQLTLSLTISNNSTATQSSIAPAAPTVSGGATFTLISGPNPATVSGLATDGSSTFTWLYRATGRGSATFSARASNGTVSSPLDTSLDVNVGEFPAVVLTTPSTTIVGGTVTLQVLPTNNTSTALTNVTPLTPQVTAVGSAAATQLSATAPSSVASLASKSTTGFTSTWRITGEPGETVTFRGAATATNSDSVTVTTNPVSSASVRIQELTLRPVPFAVLSGGGATTISYTVANGSDLPISQVVLLRPDTSLFVSQAAGTAPAGWSGSTTNNPRGVRFTAATAGAYLQPGASLTFPVTFTSIGTTPFTTTTTHRVQAVYTDGTTGRADGQVTVAVARPIPEVIIPVAVATTGRAHLSWSNPTLHDGVLILRAVGSAPNTAPTAGRRYPAGTTLGNATVVYEDAMSFTTSFADTGLTAGTRYHYRLFNRDEYGFYSPGNNPAPSPNNFLLVIAPGTSGADALWCSSMGLPALQQPFTDLGVAIYQSTNGSYFTGNVITVGAPVNGNEKWRPTLTRGVVQARPTAQRIAGATEPSLFVGDQLGYAYRISAATGAITWLGNGGVALGEVIQAQSVVALRQYASAAFQARYATDVVFFATRNSAPRTSNSVRALRVDTGGQLFSYQPGNLDQVTGVPLFEYLSGNLWVASLRTAGPSLRVLDTLNPTAAPLLTVSDLSDIPTGVTRQGYVNQALVVDRTGVARGYNLNSRAQMWQVSLGGTVTNALVPYLSDFIATTSTGVQRYRIDPTGTVVTPVWAAPTAVSNGTSVRVDAAAGKLFVGDAGGFLRRLDLATGALESSVQVSTVGGTSMPSLDTTPGLNRVYVGTADGRLCAYPTTF